MTDQTFASSEDFRRARRQAAMEELMARLRGKSAELLSFEDVRQKLKAEPGAPRGLEEIPLDSIVGSVGRYTDFTRSFLPRRDSDQERWASVEAAMEKLKGLPPIEVYQIGEAYFVLDGNHRVSAARQLGATHIQAFVTEVHSRVPFSPDVQPDDLIIKAEYADFLERTRLDELVPGVDLSVSAPGQYNVLLEHIEVHCCLMGKKEECDASDADVVLHWYNEAYWPVVQVIREQGLLRDFPGRTETDLYLWLSEHRAAVEKELGWKLTPESAASSLAEQFAPRRGRFVSRVGRRIINVFTPDELKAGPEPGRWRKASWAASRDDRLFADILVSINGDEASWHAMEQALEIARREGAPLHGLHVVTAEPDKTSEPALSVQTEFNRRCGASGVPGTLAIEVGEVARSVIERSGWTDLVVLSLEHPPAPQLMARLASGLRTILQQCSRPVLAVPREAPFPESALLAYDGSRKADEALFVAAYLSGQWKLPLVVVTVIESGRATSDTQIRAQSYLESHQVQAAYAQESGPVAEAILRTADEHDSGLISMGGYGFTPVLEVMLGSAVDQVLRESRRTMLICR